MITKILIGMTSLIVMSGCVMYPRHYSTGPINGHVLDIETLEPISGALVISELNIRNYDAMSGESSKRVSSNYAMTSTNGTFRIKPMTTLYLYYAAIMQERKASGYVSGVYHPDYVMKKRSLTNDNQIVVLMATHDNRDGFDQLKRHFKGRGKVKLKRKDEHQVLEALNVLYLKDHNPNDTETKLYKQLN